MVVRVAPPLICLLLLGMLGACGGGGETPDLLSIVHDKPLTRSDFETYLTVNLLQDKDLENRDSAYDAMMSRLLDGCIVQRVLRDDAIEAGIDVSEAELEFYLSEFYSIEGENEGSASLDEISRTRLIDRIRVQKYRDRILAHEIEDDPAALDAFFEANRDSLRSTDEVVIRSLSLDDKNRADDIYRQIRRRSTTFSEAVVFYGENEEDSDPVRVEVDLLPPEVRPAIETLLPGRTAKPWENQGRWYLFHLVSRTGPNEDDEESLRARAVRSWRDAERRRRFDEEVAKRVRDANVRIFSDRLPFNYQPPERGPLAPPPPPS